MSINFIERDWKLAFKGVRGKFVAWFHKLWHFQRRMKALELLKQDQTCAVLDRRLVEVLRKARLPIEAKGQENPQPAPGYDVKVEGKEWTLVGVTKMSGQPSNVRRSIEKLRNLKTAKKPKVYGVILAPFISEESARICEEAGVGYVDLAGNARLAFGSVYIEIRSGDRLVFEKRELQSLFSPKACRILRFLVQARLRAWKVLELHVAAKVSLGLVSGVKRQLLEREWVKETSEGIEVTKPNAILEAWAKADNWDKRTTVQEYSTLVYDPMALAQKVNTELRDYSPAFTQWFAAAMRHPLTIPPLVSAYVKAFPDDALIKDRLLGRRVDRGGVLRLIKPKDEGVFDLQKTAQGLNLVSDVQIYLDLIGAGLRGEEQAAELRKWPDFSGGWV